MAIRREPREAGKREHDARRDHHIAGVRRANGFKAQYLAPAQRLVDGARGALGQPA
ncbi:hypothetical protein [Cupriavidus necator]